jgi:hypothetical protein
MVCDEGRLALKGTLLGGRETAVADVVRVPQRLRQVAEPACFVVVEALDLAALRVREHRHASGAEQLAGSPALLERWAAIARRLVRPGSGRSLSPPLSRVADLCGQ